MKIIVDTSVLIDHLRGGHLWKNFLSKSEETDLALFIPTIVLFELFSGKSTRESSIVSKIQRLLGHFQKVELDEKIARQAGELYRDISKTLNVVDYIVAASALTTGASVLTLNRKHFGEIPGLKMVESL